MLRKDVDEKVKEIICNIGLDYKQLKNVRFKDSADWNSMKLINMIVACEKAFSIRIGARKALKINTVNDLIDCVCERIDVNE